MKDVSLMIEDVHFNYRSGLWIEKNNQVYVEVNPTVHFTTIPGGRVKTLENSKEALIRELGEEMKVELNPEELSLKAVLEDFFMYEGVPHHEMYFLYKYQVKEEDQRFKDQALNQDSYGNHYRWIDIDKLGDVNLLPSALRNLSKDGIIEHIIQNDIEGVITYE